MKNWRHNLFSRSTWGIMALFFGILFAILLIVDPIMESNAAWINGYLDIDTFIQVDDSANETSDVMYYKPDFMQWRWYYNEDTGEYEFQTRWNSDGLYSYLNQVGTEVNTEGTVLLKNDDNALPLADGANISLFGISQMSSNYITTGEGSGSHAANTTDTLRSCLLSNGVNINSTLYQTYEYLAQVYQPGGVVVRPDGDINYGEYRTDEAPFDEVENVVESTIGNGEYADCAVFIISRYGSENADTDFVEEDHVDENYLDLSEAEMTVLEGLTRYKESGKLKSIVLVLNTCNAMQFKTIDDYPIDAILWVGTGGTTSYRALADVLSGEATPSGKLADTYLYDNYSAPATVNQGNYTYTAYDGVPDTETYAHNNKYLVYQEGIYVGYKYYETRYEDMVMSQGNAVGTFGATASEGEWLYSQEVAYPFGYGLSYAEFVHSNFNVVRKDDDFYASVTITNVSDDMSGKDVFQLYLQKPYTEYDKENGVEKSSVELIGFAKTDLLAPGESQTLEINVNLSDFVSYDAYGAGTYILEAGDYYLAAGTDSHAAVNNIIAAKGAASEEYLDSEGDASMTYKVSVANDDFTTYSVSSTGASIYNRLSDVDINLYEHTSDQKITYLSRSNWAVTYPTEAVVMTCEDEGMVEDMQYAREISSDESVEMPATGQDNGLSLIDLMYEDYDSEMWDLLLDELTIGEDGSTNEYASLTLRGTGYMGGATSISAPGYRVGDGPAGIRTADDSFAYPGQTIMACTFNTELIEQLGEAFGIEMQYLGYTALYGPGANIHRNAFGGRNFEYFSEDGVLSGMMLNAELKGLTSMGIITYTKHFVGNEQERNRYGVCVWANEQSMREIYLKAFQISIEDEDCNTLGLMTSFNRIGCTWTGAHSGLLTGILREEWGFKGAVITDSAVAGYMGANGNTDALAAAVVAGQTLWLGDLQTQGFGEYMDNPVVMQAIRNACKYNLYAQLNSAAMNTIRSGVRIVEITPWWETTIFAAQIVSGVIACGSVVMTVVSFIVVRRRNKVKEEQI